jgi:hypothetical protein
VRVLTHFLKKIPEFCTVFQKILNFEIPGIFFNDPVLSMCMPWTLPQGNIFASTCDACRHYSCELPVGGGSSCVYAVSLQYFNKDIWNLKAWKEIFINN